jgi:hypothetical protein
MLLDNNAGVVIKYFDNEHIWLLCLTQTFFSPITNSVLPFGIRYQRCTDIKAVVFWVETPCNVEDNLIKLL